MIKLTVVVGCTDDGVLSMVMIDVIIIMLMPIVMIKMRNKLVFDILSSSGKVDVIVENLDNNQETERWFPVTLTTGKSPNGETPSIRLKIKYQVVIVMVSLNRYLILTYLSFIWCLESLHSTDKGLQ